MAKKPYNYNELSDVPCQAKKKQPNCTKFIKKNVLARQPDAKVCFKCTPAGIRDTQNKKHNRTVKAATAAGIPVE